MKRWPSYFLETLNGKSVGTKMVLLENQQIDIDDHNRLGNIPDLEVLAKKFLDCNESLFSGIIDQSGSSRQKPSPCHWQECITIFQHS